jgi:hypothetical protein
MRHLGPLTLIDAHFERRRRIATGVGIVMHLMNVDFLTARHRLDSAADRAGITQEQAAASLVALYGEPHP